MGSMTVLRKSWSYALMTAGPICRLWHKRLFESVAIQAVLSHTEIEDEHSVKATGKRFGLEIGGGH